MRTVSTVAELPRKLTQTYTHNSHGSLHTHTLTHTQQFPQWQSSDSSFRFRVFLPPSSLGEVLQVSSLLRQVPSPLRASYQPRHPSISQGLGGKRGEGEEAEEEEKKMKQEKEEEQEEEARGGKRREEEGDLNRQTDHLNWLTDLNSFVQ
jgi:hypothetical protein